MSGSSFARGALSTTTYTWDSQNRLTRIDFPDGGLAEYFYDPFGRRIRKRVVDAAGVETIRKYVYDAEDIVAIYDGSDALLMQFVHGPGIDEPLLVIDYRSNSQGTPYYYHTDHLGSIVAITNSGGQVVQQYRYDTYGNIVSVLDPNFEQPYAFTGREWDAESGLYFYRARYYDPQVGRFVSSDPIGLAGGVNTYQYVGGNPVNLIDPFGLLSIISSVGANSTPILGYGVDIGFYGTDSGSNNGLEYGFLATGSETIGFGAGLDTMITFLEGGIENVRGYSTTEQVCFFLCLSRVSNKNGDVVGYGFGIGLEAGFTFYDSYTGKESVYDAGKGTCDVEAVRKRIEPVGKVNVN